MDKDGNFIDNGKKITTYETRVDYTANQTAGPVIIDVQMSWGGTYTMQVNITRSSTSQSSTSSSTGNTSGTTSNNSSDSKSSEPVNPFNVPGYPLECLGTAFFIGIMIFKQKIKRKTREN
jgi:hypothetical protein